MNRTVVDDDQLGRPVERGDVVNQLANCAFDEGLAVENGNHHGKVDHRLIGTC